MWFALFWLLRRIVATWITKFGFKSTGLNKPFQWCLWISPIYYQSRDIDNFRNLKISEKMQFLTLFSFFANKAMILCLSHSLSRQVTKWFLSDDKSDCRATMALSDDGICDSLLLLCLHAFYQKIRCR